jgi:hypothetical protein
VVPYANLNHGGTENTEVAQRRNSSNVEKMLLAN